MDELISRQLPHSVEAEQAVLGSMLIDSRCVPDVVERLLTSSPQPGAQTGSKRGSGIGLRNVQERIRLYFGAEYGVTIQSEPDEGTVVKLHLPAVPYGEMEDT